jgi:hypothetical protein
MRLKTSKAVALLGGVATLALGSTFMLRLAVPKARLQPSPCAPRLLALEQVVCEPLPPAHGLNEERAELSLHAPR